MAKVDAEIRIPVLLSKQDFDALEDWRFTYRLKNRTEAVRKLIREGVQYDPVTGEARQ